MKKLLTIVVLISMAAAFSATITWRKYKEITSNVTISSTDILNIEAGTVLRFAPDVKLTVIGQIHAMGTEIDPIVFAPLDRLGMQWGGITVQSMSGNSEFNYSKFMFMAAQIESQTAGMNINESYCTINNCTFTNNNGDRGGALKITGGNVTVSNSMFYQNSAAYGGGIYVLNDSSMGPSMVNIFSCKFTKNDGYSSGGAIYIQDTTESMNNMDLNISKCGIFENFGGEGGGIYYDNQGKIDINLEKSKIFNNNASYGSAIYMKFMKTLPGNILAQRFANLLVFKNNATYQSGVYIDMGLTQNPANLKFTNTTIAFNYILPSKGEKAEYFAGIYIKPNGLLAPKIRNSIIWGNWAYEPSNYFVVGITGPLLNNVFWYCDIQGYLLGDTNKNQLPLFVRPPLMADQETFFEERFDFHESLLSPCVNFGDPAEPLEFDGTRLNMGAYGNTLEATKSNYASVPVAGNSNITVGNDAVTVLNFQGKKGTFAFPKIELGQNSQLFFQAADNAEITVDTLLTPLSKFDGGLVKIQKLIENTSITTVVHNIQVKTEARLVNTDMSDVILTVLKVGASGASPTVNIKNSKLFTTKSSPENAVTIQDASLVIIENSQFIDYANGIKIGNVWNPTTKSKAAGRLSNNTISFEPDVTSSTPKRTGIEISDAHIDVENNNISGSDEGIVMKSNSGGRISNNTVSFEADAVSKKGPFFAKCAILITGNTDLIEINGNFIKIEDTETPDITAVEINTSKAVASYNTINFDYTSTGTRNGFKFVSPTDTINVYNNTVYNALLCFDASASGEVANITNNIFWGEGTTHSTINNSTDVNFSNNCFIDSTNVSGEGNIFNDPKINSAYDDDFTLASNSPCINAGTIIDGVHVFDAGKAVLYYGTAPDIGAEELYQELTAPTTRPSTISGTNFTLKWNAVPGFLYYKVFASNNPDSAFVEVYHGTSDSLTASLDSKKFYYVIATTDAPSKFYESNENNSASAVKVTSDKITPEHKKKIRIIKNNTR